MQKHATSNVKNDFLITLKKLNKRIKKGEVDYFNHYIKTVVKNQIGRKTLKNIHIINESQSVITLRDNYGKSYAINFNNVLDKRV